MSPSALHHRKFIAQIALGILLFSSAYQNCSKVDFRSEKPSLLKGGSNNGESYSGKIYTHNDPDRLCDNGSAFNSVIEESAPGVFHLLVDRCSPLDPPRPLQPDQIEFTEDGGKEAIVYDDKLHVHQPEKPVGSPDNPYPLPKPEFTEETYPLWRGIYGPANLVYHQVWGLWEPDFTGAMLADSFATPALIRHGSTTDPSDHVSGIVPGGSLTIEASLRILPESEDDAFVIEFVDTTGMITVLLSPDKIATVRDTDLSSKSEYAFKFTDAFHKIEILRSCPSQGDPACLKYDVYVNGLPVQIQKTMGATVIPSSRISIGDLAYPSQEPRVKVELNYLRWHGRVLPR